MSLRWSELDFIKRCKQTSATKDKNLVFGIGDDCAVFSNEPHTHSIVTTDMLVEGAHFDLSWHPPFELGEKCVAVNLSDIAAMGGTPKYAFISIAIPDSLDTHWLNKWLNGVKRMLGAYDCLLAGGDTVKGSCLTINVTLFGTTGVNKAILRKGGSTGESIYVSGPLGSAAAGLRLFSKHQTDPFFNDPITIPFKNRHLSPEPEIRLGQLLANSSFVTSMQDISDGLATDLSHLSAMSGIRAVIDENLLPHHPDLPEVANFMGCDFVDLKVSGGEDYHLVFTVKKGKNSLLADYLKQNGVKNIYRIGKMEKGDGVIMFGKTAETNITFKGFEHKSNN